MKTTPLYKRLVQTIVLRKHHQWNEEQEKVLQKLVKLLPHDTEVSPDSTSKKIVLLYKDQGEIYKVIITPSLMYDFDMGIVGKEKDNLTTHIWDLFEKALKTEISC
jgi:oligoendopeptidase F